MTYAPSAWLSSEPEHARSETRSEQRHNLSFIPYKFPPVHLIALDSNGLKENQMKIRKIFVLLLLLFAMHICFKTLMVFYTIISFPVAWCVSDGYMFHFKQLNYRFMFVFHHLLSFGNITPNYNIAPVGNSYFRYEISLYKFSRGAEPFVWGCIIK